MVQTVRLTMDIPQLLNTVADVPVVQVEQVHFPIVTQRPIPMVRPVWRTLEISQLQSVQVVDISFVPQRQIPVVQAIQQTTEIPQLLFDFWWSMPFVVQVEQVHFPVVAQRHVAWSKLFV